MYGNPKTFKRCNNLRDILQLNGGEEGPRGYTSVLSPHQNLIASSSRSNMAAAILEDKKNDKNPISQTILKYCSQSQVDKPTKKAFFEGLGSVLKNNE